MAARFRYRQAADRIELFEQFRRDPFEIDEEVVPRADREVPAFIGVDRVGRRGDQIWERWASTEEPAEWIGGRFACEVDTSEGAGKAVGGKGRLKVGAPRGERRLCLAKAPSFPL